MVVLDDGAGCVGWRRRAQVPLERYFPEYTGGADINKAAKYILWRFMQANRARLSVYPQCVSLPLFFVFDELTCEERTEVKE